VTGGVAWTCAPPRGSRRGAYVPALRFQCPDLPPFFSTRQISAIRMPRSTSFPSGHSAAAFAFASGACAELPALAPALVPLAGAVAYSRVHTGVHYPSDVAAGAAIGIGSGVLATGLPRWVRRRRVERRRAEAIP